MSLSSILESEFRADIRFRGHEFVSAGRVTITAVTADELFGEVEEAKQFLSKLTQYDHAGRIRGAHAVQEGTKFHAQLTRRENKLLMACSCANGRGNPHEVRCKHLWAVRLYLGGK